MSAYIRLKCCAFAVALQVGVTAPEGFQLGLATIGGADERTCTPVELLIGREPLPVASWVIHASLRGDTHTTSTQTSEQA